MAINFRNLVALFFSVFLLIAILNPDKFWGDHPTNGVLTWELTQGSRLITPNKGDGPRTSQSSHVRTLFVRFRSWELQKVPITEPNNWSSC